jgi:hypothetical protein
LKGIALTSKLDGAHWLETVSRSFYFSFSEWRRLISIFWRMGYDSIIPGTKKSWSGLYNSAHWRVACPHPYEQDELEVNDFECVIFLVLRSWIRLIIRLKKPIGNKVRWVVCTRSHNTEDWWDRPVGRKDRTVGRAGETHLWKKSWRRLNLRDPFVELLPHDMAKGIVELEAKECSC